MNESLFLEVMVRLGMAWMATIVLLVLCSCEVEQAPPPAVCESVFPFAIAAWESASGKEVPVECRDLGAQYTVMVIDGSVLLPCDGEPRAADSTLAGCIEPAQRIIQVRQQSPRNMLSMEVHLWMHALAECMIGDVDSAHLRAGIWVARGPGSAELHAFDLAEAGGCDEQD